MTLWNSLSGLGMGSTWNIGKYLACHPFGMLFILVVV